MEKDDSLITGQSVVPEPDAGCAETCYYVGWSWDHAHKAVAAGRTGRSRLDRDLSPAGAPAEPSFAAALRSSSDRRAARQWLHPSIRSETRS